MSHPCSATKSVENGAEKEVFSQREHHHMTADDPRSKSGNHHSTFIYYDLILQQGAKGAPNHSLNRRSLQRSRRFRSKDEDHDGTWGYRHFLYTVKEEEEGDTEEHQSHSHSHSRGSSRSHSLQRSNNFKSNSISIADCYDLMMKSKEEEKGETEEHNSRSHSRSHGLQRSNNCKSNSISIADCYDLMMISKEKRGGALGGMLSNEGKGKGDGSERNRRRQTSQSYGIHSHGGGGGREFTPPKTKLPLMKKRTKTRLAFNGSTPCYSQLFLCLLLPLKRLRDRYIKCCFSLAGGAGDLSALVREDHVVGPLFHEWFPRESTKLATPRSDNILLWY